MTTTDWQNWGRKALAEINDIDDGDYATYVHPRVERDTLRLMDAVAAQAPATDGRDDLADLERVIGLARRHADTVRAEIDHYDRTGEERKIVTTWRALQAYQSVCSLGARLGIAGGREFVRACRAGG